MSRPLFAEWLADPNAPEVTLDDSGGLLDWVGQAYGEQGIEKILDAIREDHSQDWIWLEFMMSKDERIDGPWEITDAWGTTSHMAPLHVEISFKTTDVYL